MNLETYIDIKYKTFQQKLIVSKHLYLGIRIPMLRKIAKTITFDEFINNYNLNLYEEVLLYGMLIPKIKNDEERLNLINDYLQYIDCWSICDIFCSNLSFVKNDLDKYFNWIVSYLEDNRQFYVRFSLVMLLKYYNEKNYIDSILNNLKCVKNKDYYCEMALAWLLCELAVLDKNKIDTFVNSLSYTVQKMYQRKIKDSLKIK